MNKATVNGYFNDQNVLERVETKIDNAVQGEMPNETTFTDYKDFSGVKFPTHILQKQGGYPALTWAPNAASDRERQGWFRKCFIADPCPYP
jgi:hypothetical protein